jgi:hypothetical protein
MSKAMQSGHAARLLLEGGFVAEPASQGNGSAAGQPDVSAGKQNVVDGTDFLSADIAEVAPVSTRRFSWRQARAWCYSSKGQGVMPDARTSG